MYTYIYIYTHNRHTLTCIHTRTIDPLHRNRKHLEDFKTEWRRSILRFIRHKRCTPDISTTTI